MVCAYCNEAIRWNFVKFEEVHILNHNSHSESVTTDAGVYCSKSCLYYMIERNLRVA